MAPSSTFYFNSNAYPAQSGRDLIREIPTYAIHALNSSYNGGWESNAVQRKNGFENLVGKISPQVAVHLAMPRVIADRHFSVGTNYPKLAVDAFTPRPGMAWMNGGYMTGASITLVLKDLTVASVTPIPQMAGLPSLKEAQRNYLEKLLGRDTYNAVAVKFNVLTGDVV